jgi:hypothetical protein
MNPVLPTRHGLRRRAARTFSFAAAWVACVGLSACGNRTDPSDTSVPRSASASVGATKAAAPEEQPTPAEARARVIRHDADAIRAECRQAAGGDWERWLRDTTPYRAALKARVDALKPLDPPPGKWPEVKSEPLEGFGNFPLFEVGPHEYLPYLYETDSFDKFLKERSVLAVQRWLRARGIDLIFVVVPRMSEVYVEHFLDPCPPDGIIAPHARRTLLELLDEGIEVVDGYSLFRPVRNDGTEYLYNTADSHWAPRAMQVMARELVGRIGRYDFGARARHADPIVVTTPGPYSVPGLTFPPSVANQNGWKSLSPQQQQRAAAVQTKVLPYVLLPDGRLPPDDPKSPVLLVGHSYVNHFRERFINELNLLIRTRQGSGATTEVFADFLREPELLDNCKVLVWITTEKHLLIFKPLPEAIQATLQQ